MLGAIGAIAREIATEQADAIEVLRGPATALYGSNAVHGTVNVVEAAPAERRALGDLRLLDVSDGSGGGGHFGARKGAEAIQRADAEITGDGRVAHEPDQA